jgi:hypothetical protein
LTELGALDWGLFTEVRRRGVRPVGRATIPRPARNFVRGRLRSPLPPPTLLQVSDHGKDPCRSVALGLGRDLFGREQRCVGGVGHGVSPSSSSWRDVRFNIASGRAHKHPPNERSLWPVDFSKLIARGHRQLIQRSAWKGYSAKFTCRILHRSPLRAARWPSCGWAASGAPRTGLVSGVQKAIQYNPLGELLREAHHG